MLPSLLSAFKTSKERHVYRRSDSDRQGAHILAGLWTTPWARYDARFERLLLLHGPKGDNDGGVVSPLLMAAYPIHTADCGKAILFQGNNRETPYS